MAAADSRGLEGAWRRSLRRAALLAATTGLLLPAGASAERGRIDTRVDERSGRLAIIGASEAPLRESRRRGPGPGGRLGFRAGGRWYHAKRLLRERDRGGRRALLLATSDPSGRRIRVRIGRSAGGVLRITASVIGHGPTPVRAVGVGFGAPARERMLGFGERSNRVDQRGNTVESYVGEGPFQRSEYPIVEATIPPWGIRERRDATYFPMPWLLSSRGYGVLVDNLETSRFRLASAHAGEWSVEVDARRLALRIFAGPRPRDALRRLTEAIGRQPKPAAPWLFGPWFQTGHANTEPDELSHVRALRRADAPISAVETHMRYMPCGSDRGQAAEERRRAAAFHRAGLAALTYTREAICESYEGPFRRAVAADAFLERRDGSPYTFRAFVGGGVTQVGMLDFTDPEAFRIYRSLLDRAYRAGYDGWMEDYGEYTPPDSVAENGMGGRRMHNRYPVAYHRAGLRYARSHDRPIIRFNRSGYTGAARYSQVVWGGDPTTGWGFDGLRSSVRQALSMGLSGVSLWGSDIGGFFTLSGRRLTPELLARWIQFGAFSGVMRTKAEGIGVPKSQRPQIWERPTLPIWRRYAKLRTQLYPYLVAADRTYRRTGMPMVRQLALAYPRDGRAVRRESEYLFGPDLLVAPVLEPGRRSRRLYLPPGGWVDFWDAISYGRRRGAFHLRHSADVVRGGRPITADAPVTEVPLFLRAGTLLPLLSPDVETLAPYGRRRHVGLDDRRGQLRLIALPRGRSAARFGMEGLLRSREREGLWRLRISSPRRIQLEIEASMSTLRQSLRPRSVTLDGRRLRHGWSFDPGSDVLRISVPVRDGVIAIRGR